MRMSPPVGSLSFRLRRPAVRVGLLCLLAAAFILSFTAAARADAGDDHYNLAATLFRDRQWQQAAREFRSFLDRYPGHAREPDALFFLGESYVQARDYAEARAPLEEFLSRYGEHRRAGAAWYRLGEAHYLLGQYDDARQALGRFVEDFGDDALDQYALPYLADAELQVGDAGRARELFQQALDRFPDGRLAPECRYGLARALERLGETDQAITLYRTLAADEQSYLADDAQLRIGSHLFEARDFAAAIDAFEQLAQRWPESPLAATARLNQAWACYHLQRYGEAESLFAALAANAEVGVTAEYWRGMSLRAQEQWREAAAVLQALAESHPAAAEAPDAMFYAADALVSAGDSAQARIRFSAVADRWPDAEIADDALHRACEAALYDEQYEALDALAARFAEQFAASPLIPNVRQVQARACLRRQRYADAVTLLEPLVGQAGDAHEATTDADAALNRYYLAAALQGIGEHERALVVVAPVASAAVRSAVTVEANYLAGVSHFALGEYPEALDHFEAYLTACQSQEPPQPGADRALAWLALTSFRLGDTQQARQRYERLATDYADSGVVPATAYYLAEDAYQAGDFDFAAELYAVLAGEGEAPAPPQAWADYRVRALSGLAWCSYAAEDYAAAAERFGRLVAQHAGDPLAPEACYMHGRALQAAGRLDEAAADYQRVLADYAQSDRAPPAAHALARLERDRGRLDAASAAYARLANDFAQNDAIDAVLYEWALVEHSRGRAEQANALFLQLARDHPSSPYAADSLLNVADARYRTRDWDGAAAALAELDALRRTQPDSVPPRVRQWMLYLAGRIAIDRADWDAAEQAFHELIAQPNGGELAHEAEFWLVEADYYRTQRDEQPNGNVQPVPSEFYARYAAALERLDTVLAGADPTGPDGRPSSAAPPLWLPRARLRRPMLLFAMARCSDDIDQRRELYRACIADGDAFRERFPDDPLAYEVDYLLGRSFAALAQFDQARSAYRRVIDSPNGRRTETAARAQLMIGETYFHQEQYEQAVSEYLQVWANYAYPQWQAMALLEAGKCHLLRGDTQEAARCFREILQSFPDTQFAGPARQRLDELTARMTRR